VKINNLMNYLVTDYNGIDIFMGTPLHPFGDFPLSIPNSSYISGSDQASVWGTSLPLNDNVFVTNHPDAVKYAATYIPNVYKVTDNKYGMNVGDLIGFVHVEIQHDATAYARCEYVIGLAYSRGVQDQGKKWTYVCGIIRPFEVYGPYDPSNVHTHNVGGVPYVVKTDPIKGDSFYVYFNEYTEHFKTDPNQNDGSKGLSVASAKLSDVISGINAVMNADASVQKARDALNSALTWPADQLQLAIQNLNNAVEGANAARQSMVKWHKYLGNTQGWSTKDATLSSTTTPVGDKGYNIGPSAYVAPPSPTPAGKDLGPIHLFDFHSCPNNQILTS
jgi:hypothetical protein